MMNETEFAIIGGGVAGLTAAIGLQQVGSKFEVFEQAKELKGIGAGFGLAANAMQAFDLLGIKEKVEQVGFYTNSYNILDHKGNVLLAPDTQKLTKQYNQDNFTVHRADLHKCLLAQIDNKKIHLNKKAIRFEKKDGKINLYFADGSTHGCRYLIIADGVKSTLRQQLLPDSKPRYAGYTCWRAIIDNSSIKLTKGSETWGRAGRFGMTPLIGNRIYWYACVNSTASNPLYQNYAVINLAEHFKGYHEPIPQILHETLDKDLIWNDIMDIKPIKNFAYDNILLIGDAAHATTPNLGQGACQAIEDVAVLVDELQKNMAPSDAFKNFERRRIARAKYIIETSKKIGKIAQLQNPLLINIRNIIMQILPTKIAQSSLDKLLSVNFMDINNQ